MNIYVGNLPYSMTEEDLRTAFGQYGSVRSASLIMDKMTNRSKGFGFVEMEDAGAAQQAISALNGKSMGGRNITVNEARPRDAARPRPSGGGGGGYRPRA